jgi:hypothetical protein
LCCRTELLVLHSLFDKLTMNGGLIEFSIAHDKVPVRPDREPVERSKGMSEWAQGFDKLSPNGG